MLKRLLEFLMQYEPDVLTVLFKDEPDALINLTAEIEAAQALIDAAITTKKNNDIKER